MVNFYFLPEEGFLATSSFIFLPFKVGTPCFNYCDPPQNKYNMEKYNHIFLFVTDCRIHCLCFPAANYIAFRDGGEDQMLSAVFACGIFVY